VHCALAVCDKDELEDDLIELLLPLVRTELLDLALELELERGMLLTDRLELLKQST
jgi:hypothetical protein